MEKLEKTLTAYDKAVAVIATKDEQIGAHKILEDIYKQWIAVKDQIIAAQAQLIGIYEKRLNVNKSKIRELIERAEKALIFAAGVYLGHL